MRERGEQAVEYADHLRQGQRADERPQRAALEVLHGDVRLPLLMDEVEHRHDARVAQRTCDTRFPDEPLGERLVRGMEGRELLERDVASERRLAREVHDGHPAAPELANDLVGPDAPRHPPTLSPGDERGAPAPSSRRPEGPLRYGLVVDSVNVSVLLYVPVRSGSLARIDCLKPIVTISLDVGAFHVLIVVGLLEPPTAAYVPPTPA